MFGLKEMNMVLVEICNMKDYIQVWSYEDRVCTDLIAVIADNNILYLKKGFYIEKMKITKGELDKMTKKLI